MLITRQKDGKSDARYGRMGRRGPQSRVGPIRCTVKSTAVRAGWSTVVVVLLLFPEQADDSLRAALNLDEIRALAQTLGVSAATVEATSDRHWTWAARK